MVINGEKSPAFSAKTLNLPPPQDDNTGRIIQWTREYYSRNREDIEREISDRILPPENLTVKRPGPAYTAPKSPEQREQERLEKEAAMLEQGKTWPISNVTPDEVNTALQIAKKEQGSGATEITEVIQGAHKAPSEPIGSGANSEEKPKRKRSRSRKRKSSSGAVKSEEATSAPKVTSESQPKEPSDTGVLSIR